MPQIKMYHEITLTGSTLEWGEYSVAYPTKTLLQPGGFLNTYPFPVSCVYDVNTNPIPVVVDSPPTFQIPPITLDDANIEYYLRYIEVNGTQLGWSVQTTLAKALIQLYGLGYRRFDVGVLRPT